MKQMCRILSVVMLLLIAFSSVSWAKVSDPKRIAVLPLVQQNCARAAISDELEKKVNDRIQQAVGEGLDSFIPVIMIEKTEAMPVIEECYANRLQVTKKATYRDALAPAARKLKADLIVLPVADNCSSFRTDGAYGRDMINNSATVRLYMFSKLEGTATEFKASESYNAMGGSDITFDNQLYTCVLRVIRDSKLSNVVSEVTGSW